TQICTRDDCRRARTRRRARLSKRRSSEYFLTRVGSDHSEEEICRRQVGTVTAQLVDPTFADASAFNLKNDFHSFARDLRVGEPSLAQLFHSQEKLVIVLRVVVGHGEMLNPGHLCHLHGLVETAVSPAPMRP